jgi:polysaccharide biosynthesis protein PslH
VRVLHVVHEPPLPPYNGQRLVLASLLPHLRDEHEVRVLSLDGVRTGPVPPWLRLVPPPSGPLVELASVVRFLRGRPLRADAMARALWAPLAEELQGFDPDLVHVGSGQLASLRPAVGQRPALLTALDAGYRNIEARAALLRGPRRLALRRQARHQRRFITTEFPRYSAVVMVTPQDAEAVRVLAPTADVRAIPNGVDTARYSSGPADRRGHRIVLHGAMGYPPNIDAAQFAAHEVLPRVRRAEPAAELVLVGRSPSPEVLALADRPGVTVTGEVEDVVPWLASAAVYLCPMRRGTGIKNKLLEAMAAGAPCVVTPLALQGIPAESGRDVLVGGDAAELAEHVVDILRDHRLGDRLGSNATALVSRHHSWEAVAAAYAALYVEIVAGSERRRRGASG